MNPGSQLKTPLMGPDLPRQEIAAFCRRWQITELALFGSALREDFGPESDIDFLVTFAKGTTWSLLDKSRMREELENLLGRGVDLINRRAVERSHNWIRREAILSSARVYYAS